MSLIRFTDIFKRSLIINFKVISVEFNTKEFFIDFVDSFDHFFNIGIVLIFRFLEFIELLGLILGFEEFTIGEIILFMFVGEIILLFVLSSIRCKEVFIVVGEEIE